MSVTPRVVIGAPLYNNAAHLAEALESILSQTYVDFALVLIDDCSTDDTPRVAGRYAGHDGRVHHERNPKRLGMVGNWRRTFEVARSRYPSCEYFAWGSDHDVWHPRWIESLVAELDRSPEAVLAYPLNMRISGTGEVVRRPWHFDTRGVAEPRQRLKLAVQGMSAGNMVYGLARRDALERCGVFRSTLLPDRLLLAELSVRGELRQVPEILWYRRFTTEVSLARQRAAFYPDGIPVYSYLPWWTAHSCSVAWSLGVRGSGLPRVSRLAGLRLALDYLWMNALREGTHRLKGRVIDPLTVRRRHAARSARFASKGVNLRIRQVRRKVHRRRKRWSQRLEEASAFRRLAGPLRDARVAPKRRWSACRSRFANAAGTSFKINGKRGGNGASVSAGDGTQSVDEPFHA